MGRFLAAAFALLVIGIIALLAWPEASYQRFEPAPDYLAQAERYTVPPMPEDWRQRLYDLPDGAKLRWGETGNRNSAKATIVFVPGYTATLDMYGEHFDRLARRGYHVIGVDLRGQGMSSRDREDQPEKLYVDSFATYSDDLARFIRDVSPTDRPVVPMAMSFGGHVAMRMALEQPDVMDGLYLVAPALQPQLGEAAATTRRVASAMKRLGKGRRYLPGQGNWTTTMDDLGVAGPQYCASDPKRLHLKDVIYTRRPEQRVGGVTAGWGLAFIASAEWLAKPDRYAAFDRPVRMVLAETEAFVENDANTAACGAMLDCEATVLPGTAHCLNQESDAVLKRMWDGLDAFVATLSPAGEG